MSSIIMAFDFGTKRIGIAISQHITYTARPLTTLISNKGTPNWSKLEKIIYIWQPVTLIVGLPLNMDGSEQSFTFSARKFAKMLYYKFGIKVIMHDERLSTVEARAFLFKLGGYKFLKKCNIDAESAVVILDSWLAQ